MKLRFVQRYIAVTIALVLPAIAVAVDFNVTPAVQAKLDRDTQMIAGWAANPAVVAAVKEQNRKGPLADMTNASWKGTRRTDSLIKRFQTNPAGELLRSKMRESGGAVTEVFLNGAKGEKVAFAEKTTSYIHAGSAKHDVPFGTGKAWQGKPEFDESSQTYAIQVSVPVLDGGTPIGSLVVGVNLSHLKSAAR